MIYLTRGVGQSVIIGETAVVFLGEHNGQVRLGVVSPHPVYRKEIFDRLEDKEDKRGSND